jgi:hypothetical protein
MNGDSDITEMAKRIATRPNAAAGIFPQNNANKEASGLSLLGQRP